MGRSGLTPVLPAIDSPEAIMAHLDTIKGLVEHGAKLLREGGSREFVGCGALIIAADHMRALAKATDKYQKPISDAAWSRGPNAKAGLLDGEKTSAVAATEGGEG